MEKKYETISKDQLDELRSEIKQYPDLENQIISNMDIWRLEDIPSCKYQLVIDRLRMVIQTRNGVK